MATNRIDVDVDSLVRRASLGLPVGQIESAVLDGFIQGLVVFYLRWHRSVWG